MSNKTPREIREHVKKKSHMIAELFSSKLGQEVLGFLHEEFDRDELRANSVENTYYNLGNRDVVVYIEQMIKHDGADDD